MARYDAGETLASIARTYDCSPPAISYVVSRSRTRQPESEGSHKPLNASEPQLIKAISGETANASAPVALPEPTADAAASPPEKLPPVSAEVPRAHDDAPNGAGVQRNGSNGGSLRASPPAEAVVPQRPVAAPPANGDHRRTLHLSLGGSPHGNGGSRAGEQPIERPAPIHRAQPAVDPAAASPSERAGNGAAAPFSAGQRDRDYSEPPHHNGGDAPPRRENGAFIDRDLRARVEADIGAFLAAFDDALAQDTLESRSALREATDRLLRAGARTRIELERLEARVPLSARDAGSRGHPAWRER
ncbi:MAG TPA: hypothetical protein VME41_06300 [Stellaceae bacterium]|nr:hypothetical protein [Stellaceae bacterium]